MRKIIALSVAALLSLAAVPVAVAAEDPAGTVLIQNALTAEEDTANPEFEAKAAIATAGVVKSAMEGVSATAIDAALQPSHYLRWKPAAGRLAAGTYEVWAYNIGKIDSTEKWRGGAQVVSDPYAKFLIKGAAGTAVQYVNQATATGGKNDWLSLGTYTFSGNGEEYVELNKTTNPNWSSFTYGDDVKFVPVTVNENKLLHVYAVADDARLQEDEAEVTGDRIVKRIPASAAAYTVTLEATPGAVVTVDGVETNVITGAPVPGTTAVHAVAVGEKTYTLILDMEGEELETIALPSAVTTQKVGANVVFEPAALTADKAGWYNVYINVGGPQNYVNTEKVHVAVSHAGLREEAVVYYGRYANQSAWVCAGKYYFSGQAAAKEQIVVTKSLSNTGDYMVVQNVKLVKAAADVETDFVGLSVLTDDGYKSIPAEAFDGDGSYMLPAQGVESVILFASDDVVLTVNGTAALPQQTVTLPENAGQITVTAEKDGTTKTYTVVLATPDVTVRGEDAVLEGTAGEAPMLLGEDGLGVQNVANTGGSLTYSAALPAAGTYRIFAWRPAFTAESDTAFGAAEQTVEIETAAGTKTVTVDWKSTPSKWVDLGTYKLGAKADVKFTKAGEAAFLLADDVVFAKQSVYLDGTALEPEALNGYQYSVPSDSIYISANLSPYMKLGSTVLESGTTVSLPLSVGSNALTLSVYSDSAYNKLIGSYTFNVLSTGVTVGQEEATKTGTWTESAVAGYAGGRKAVTTAAGGTLTFPAEVTGQYAVLVWRGEGSAAFTASVNGKEAAVPAGGAGWVSLGSYSFTGAAGEGVTVTAAAGSSVYVDAVRFVQDDAKMVASLEGIKSATEMKAVIEEWAPKWGIAMDGDFAALSANGKMKVYEALCGRKYADVLDVAKAFAFAAAVVRLNEATPKNTALLSEKASILEIDMGENSAFAGLADKTEVYAAMLGADLPPEDKAAVQKTFADACVFAEVQTLTTANQDKLPEYAEKMGVDLAEYEDLSTTKQAEVIRDVMQQKPFKDAAAFRSAFEDAVEDAAKFVPSTGSGSSTGGSSGRGGGGGGFAFAVDDKTLNTVKETAGTADVAQTTQIFPDVPATHWASESIAYLQAQGVLSGYEDGTFRPDSPVKREEFVKILMEALPIPAEETNKTFSDVSADDWFYTPVMRAYAVNLVKGVDFGVFGTGQYITREQLCTIVWRSMKLCDLYLDEGEAVTFIDADAVSDYAREAVAALSQGGIVSGMGDGSFAPQGTATRAQVAKIIYGLLKGGVAA